MELRQLESFVAVASLGSFTKAAQALSFDQSTVTRHVQQLEREIKIALLCRKGRRVELTSEGRLLLPHARRIVDSVRRAADLASLLRGERDRRAG
jgi:DNA-binding transcriptional LysR family regulator